MTGPFLFYIDIRRKVEQERRRIKMGFWDWFLIGLLIGFFMTYRKE